MKTTIAKVRAAFLPKMSLNRPYNGWKQVEVRRSAEGTQDTIDPALKAEDIVGIAVATMTESMIDTTIHRAKPRKHAIIFLEGRKLV